MTANTATPNVTDYLKFCAAETKAQLDDVMGRLAQADAEHPLTNNETERMNSILTEVQNIVGVLTRGLLGVGADLNTYTDGRRVETILELAGSTFTYRWHPRPDHPANRPSEVVGMVVGDSDR
ncbi:hypothetical protein KIH27_08060 [Mycobacterium sp. M1]|uniref:Uncharacterized protein n=1 Tax=Mycolicibacter acidiphilus TaxID=2835306 RepID=A0ABS5RJ90_9MYCO|nr:hypothetical protein [Mycolicibacter acidiphilus]MBS9533541.1 hypothetical protein [Mycolicibacter acidiphilus]